MESFLVTTSHPVGFLNGHYLPADQISVSVADAGFVMGATVAEQIRTFAGKPFLLNEHLGRLRRSLTIVDVDPGMTDQQLTEAVTTVTQRNHALLAADDDLGINLFVTPGLYPTMAQGRDAGPQVGIITYPLPFARWMDKYQSGHTLLTASVRQVPASCWPAELKCRSRMHYFLADREVRRIDPAAQALMLDQQGHVCETPTANIVAYFHQQGLVSPPREAILPGISLMYLQSLAQQLSIPITFETLAVDQLLAADEILLTGTSMCLQPVVTLNDQPVGSGRPGEVYQSLLSQWSRSVGVDIRAQAALCGQRR